MLNIDDFYSKEIDCIYKGDHYSVRDNGTVMRHHQENKRKRKYDDIWTFGNANVRTGYMELSGERIHRIVATAFHGEPPTVEHVVDHIDTNRKNNRPENLRWVTRLENALLNPITRKKIEWICGSVENFLANPSLLRKHENIDKNFSWMRTVSPDEAQMTLQRLKEWSKSSTSPHGGKMGEWIFKEQNSRSASIIQRNSLYSEQTEVSASSNKDSNKKKIISQKNSDNESFEINADNEKENIFDLHTQNSTYAYHPSNEHMKENQKVQSDSSHGRTITESLTPNAVQVDWKTPSEFPYCPTNIGINPLTEYASKLKAGKIFCQNKYYKSVISDFALANEGKDLLVITTSDNPKPWALAKVTYKDGMFYHSNEGSFFEENGAQKYFTLAQGKEWAGEDCIEDYC